jgi:hypothetical protein
VAISSAGLRSWRLLRCALHDGGCISLAMSDMANKSHVARSAVDKQDCFAEIEDPRIYEQAKPALRMFRTSSADQKFPDERAASTLFSEFLKGVLPGSQQLLAKCFNRFRLSNHQLVRRALLDRLIREFNCGALQ